MKTPKRRTPLRFLWLLGPAAMMMFPPSLSAATIDDAITAEAYPSATPTLRELNSRGRATAEVEQLSVDPRGRLAGLVLHDGTWVEASPAQSQRLAEHLRPGAQVLLSYGPASMLQVTHPESGAIVDIGPLTPARGGGPNASDGADRPRAQFADLEPMSVEGRVRTTLYTLGGRPAGVVLEDGTEVHVPMNVAEVVRSAPAGTVIRVEGRGTSSERRTSLWALQITQPGGRVLLTPGTTPASSVERELP